MDNDKTFDDELRELLKMLDFHKNADNDEKDDFVRDISDWFDYNAVYVGGLDTGLYQAINKILDDGVITDEEYDTIVSYIDAYLDTHKRFDYKSYKEGKQRLTCDEIKNIEPYIVGDKDFIGKVVVITGDLERFPVRKEAEIEIRKRGGKTASSISGATNIVVCGDGAGWKKVKQVKQRNEQGQKINLVDEKTFYKMLESNDAVIED